MAVLTYWVHKVRIEPITKLLDARGDFVEGNPLLASICHIITALVFELAQLLKKFTGCIKKTMILM